MITLESGERLLGEVLPESDETTLVLQSNLLGTLRLPRAVVTGEKSLEQEAGDAPVSEGAALPAAETAKTEVAVSPQPMEEKHKASTQVIPLSDEEIALMLDESLIDKLLNWKSPEDWSGNLRFGLDLSYGDSQWSELNTRGNLVIDPKNSPNYYRFTGSHTYRTTERNGESVKSIDRYDGNFTYRRDTLGPFFLQNSLGARVDQVRGIDHEIQELVGLGIRYEPSERLVLVVGAGGGVEYFDPNFEDTRSGLNPVANFFQELTWRPFKRASLAQEFNYFVNPSLTEQFNYVFSASFRYRFTDLLGFEISVERNFDNDVGNGNFRDDSRWRNALIVYF